MFRKFFSAIGDKIKKEGLTIEEGEVGEGDPAFLIAAQAS